MADNTLATDSSGKAVSVPFPSVSVTYRGDAGRIHSPSSLSFLGADDGDTTLTDVRDTNPLPVKLPGAGTATTTAVSTSTTSATLFSASSGSKGRIIWNRSSAILWLRFAAVAAAEASATLPMEPGAVLMIPPGWYYGEIRGILSTGTGSAHCTELTA